MSDEIDVTFVNGDTVTILVESPSEMPITLFAGVPGTDGRSVRSGPADPGVGDGYVGDFWLNTTTSTLFGPKVGAAWGVGVSLIGPSPVITIGAVVTGAPGSPATVQDSGTPMAPVLDFSIPEGDKGDTGDQGPAGTIAINSVTTVAPGSPATVTNVGTPEAAILDIEIPKGDLGNTGPASAWGTIPGTLSDQLDLQAALDAKADQTDVDTRATAAALTAHTGAAAGAHAASAIASTPSGNLAATEVQAALNELQTDVDTRATSTALTTHTGDTTSPHSIRRYSADVAMDGSQTTKDVNVSASISDARLAIWQLLDLSTNDFERLLVSIKTPSATTVHITSDPPLAAGNYRLIGVQL